MQHGIHRRYHEVVGGVVLQAGNGGNGVQRIAIGSGISLGPSGLRRLTLVYTVAEEVRLAVLVPLEFDRVVGRVGYYQAGGGGGGRAVTLLPLPKGSIRKLNFTEIYGHNCGLQRLQVLNQLYLL